MKIIIEGSDLKKLYDRCKSVVIKNAPLKYQRCVKIGSSNSGIHCYFTNMDDFVVSSIYGDVIESGDVFIDVDDLKLICGISGTVTITYDKLSGVFDVRNNKKSYGIKGYDFEEEFITFPDKPMEKYISYDEKELLKHLSLVNCMRSQNNAKPIMTAFNIDLSNDRICTIDGHRVGIAHLNQDDIKSGLKPLNASGKIYNVLKALIGKSKGNLDIYGCDKYIKFIGDDYEYTSKLVEGVFFNIDNITRDIMYNHDYKYSADNKELGGVAKEYSKLITTDFTAPMVFSNYNHEIKTGIIAGDYRTSDLLEKIDNEIGMEKDFVVGLNPKYVYDACNMFDGKFNIMGNYKPTYPVIFHDDTYDALILPIHISSDSNTVNYIRGL